MPRPRMKTPFGEIPKPAIDVAFLKSSLGILKVFQIVWSLLGFILSDIRRWRDWGGLREQWDAYEAMSAILFFSSLLIWAVFLASWHDEGPLSCINWLGLDVFHSGLGCVMSFVNLIFAFSISTQTWEGEVIPIFCIILAGLCCLKFTLTSRMSYRKWHALRPTPVISYQDYKYTPLGQTEEEL